MFTRKSARHETAFEVTKTEEEWKAELPRDRYAVLRRAGTEPAGSGTCCTSTARACSIAPGAAPSCSTPAPSSSPATGWPSFDRARSAGTVVEHKDRSFGMARTEILVRPVRWPSGACLPRWAHRHRAALLRQLALPHLRARRRRRRRRGRGGHGRGLSLSQTTLDLGTQRLETRSCRPTVGSGAAGPGDAAASAGSRRPRRRCG